MRKKGIKTRLSDEGGTARCVFLQVFTHPGSAGSRVCDWASTEILANMKCEMTKV